MCVLISKCKNRPLFLNVLLLSAMVLATSGEQVTSIPHYNKHIADDITEVGGATCLWV